MPTLLTGVAGLLPEGQRPQTLVWGLCLGNNSGMAVKSQEKRSNTRWREESGFFLPMGVTGSGVGAAAAAAAAATLACPPIPDHPGNDGPDDQQQNQTYQDLPAVQGQKCQHSIMLLSQGLTPGPRSGRQSGGWCSPGRAGIPGTEGPPAGRWPPRSRG